jgi:hypothetical protein
VGFDVRCCFGVCPGHSWARPFILPVPSDTTQGPQHSLRSKKMNGVLVQAGLLGKLASGEW